MSQIFLSSSDSAQGLYRVRGDDYHHLSRVLRVKKNDIINIRDSHGILVRARIVEITGSEIVAESVERIPSTVSGLHLIVAVSLLKGKKYDFVLQKLTELGVACIVPVISERSIPVLKDRAEYKKERWVRIIESASKQCMRVDVPVIEEAVSLQQYIAHAQGSIKIIAHPRGSVSLHQFLSGRKDESEAHLLIGPEGGFSDGEVEEAAAHGWHAVQFGFTSLRAETAAIILPSLIMYEWGN